MKCDGCKKEKPELDGLMFTVSKQFCDACLAIRTPEYAIAECGHRVRVGGVGCDACAES